MSEPPKSEQRPLTGVKVRPRRPTSGGLSVSSASLVDSADAEKASSRSLSGDKHTTPSITSPAAAQEVLAAAAKPADAAEKRIRAIASVPGADHSTTLRTKEEEEQLAAGRAPAAEHAVSESGSGSFPSGAFYAQDLPPELQPDYVRPSRRKRGEEPSPVGTAPKPGNRSSMHDLLANLADRAGDVEHLTESVGRVSRDPHERLVGTTVDGKYHIASMVGRGGSGTVFKARHLVFENFVALKVLHPHLAADDRALRRFLHEARTVVKLRHPNAIDIHDFGVVSGLPYLVMEYIEGKSLTDLILEVGPIPLPRAARILEQICGALASAHRLGIIHRDLKPDNIMVSSDSEGHDFIRVLDFGIAKLVNDTSPDGAKMTRDGTPCGTPHYMSPEQVLAKTLDPRSDLYSLGIILYEMLTGTPPFSEYSPIEVMFKQVHSVPPPPSEFKPELNIPASIERIVARLLEKEPDARFQNAEELSQTFNEAVASPSRPTLVPHFGTKGRRWLKAPANGVAPRSLVQEAVMLGLFIGAVTGVVLCIKFRRDVRAYLGANVLKAEQSIGFRLQPLRYVLSLDVDFDESALFSQIDKNDIYNVRTILAAGLSPNSKDKEGTPALHRAIRRGLSDIALELMRNGADATSRTPDGVTALMAAAARDEVPLIHSLKMRGASLEERDRKNRTPLMYAIENKNRGAMHALLTLGASVHAVDEDGTSILLYLIRSGLHDEIEQALDRGAAINARPTDGRTALWTAAEQGDLATVKLLLTRGADPQTRDEKGVTALMVAARKNDKQLIHALMDAGSDPSATDLQGKSASDYLPSNCPDEIRSLFGENAPSK